MDVYRIYAQVSDGMTQSEIFGNARRTFVIEADALATRADMKANGDWGDDTAPVLWVNNEDLHALSAQALRNIQRELMGYLRWENPSDQEAQAILSEVETELKAEGFDDARYEANKTS